jgi:hypothetical protein
VTDSSLRTAVRYPNPNSGGEPVIGTGIYTDPSRIEIITSDVGRLSIRDDVIYPYIPIRGYISDTESFSLIQMFSMKGFYQDLPPPEEDGAPSFFKILKGGTYAFSNDDWIVTIAGSDIDLQFVSNEDGIRLYTYKGGDGYWYCRMQQRIVVDGVQGEVKVGYYGVNFLAIHRLLATAEDILLVP